MWHGRWEEEGSDAWASGERCRTTQRRPARQRRRRAAPAADHGQAAGDVVERGGASAGARSGGAKARTARGTVLSGAEPAVMTHMAELRRRHAAGGNRGGREGGRRRGLRCKFREKQGPDCNVSITFKPVLKWRWSQKQKCIVFQALQLCFRFHLQKSNSFEIKIKLSKVFKLYINPI
jgi:hypothetical protein